jgi:D-methionine transport system substrate-binding protein
MSEPTQPTSGGGSDLRASVEANGKRTRRTLLIIGAVVVAAALFVGGLFTGRATADATPTASSSGSAAPLVLRIATSDDSKFQDEIKTVAAEKGLDVEWVNLNDWVLPNTELAAGNVDGNAFQHILYLSQFNVKNNATITPVFSTVITQWGIFSKTLKDIKDIKDGGHIAIPDDASNGARALFILQTAGLIKIKSGVGDFPSVDDVSDNPKHLVFVPIAAKTIPQQYDDPSLSAVVVGTSYFDPKQGITSKDALYLDDSLAKENLPYINVIATREQDKNKPAWKILKAAYADKRVAAALKSETGASSVIVNVPVDTLRSKLKDLEAEAKKTN